MNLEADILDLEPKKYDPDYKLIKYMRQKSYFEQRKKKLNERTEELENERLEKPKRLLSAAKEEELEKILKEIEDIDAKLPALKNAKRVILDDIIFPSMANICFFFESLLEFTELKDNFESDVSQLLGIRRLYPRTNNYAFVFVTLINAMITSKEEYQENDFRIRLVHELQKQVYYKFVDLSKRTFPPGFKGWSEIVQVLNQDMNRAVGWTGFIASKINDECDPEKINVQSDSKKKKKKLKKDALPKPHRTFDFNTRELIEQK